MLRPIAIPWPCATPESVGSGFWQYLESLGNRPQDAEEKPLLPFGVPLWGGFSGALCAVSQGVGIRGGQFESSMPLFAAIGGMDVGGTRGRGHA